MKWGSLRVLIADDIPSTRAIVRSMLEAIGFEQFDEAEDGEGAWKLLMSSGQKGTVGFDLVISDWLMPGMDGLTLVSQIRRQPETRHIPVLMITSQSSRDHWLSAQDAGVSGFIVKPFDQEQLREEITRVCGS